MRIVHSILSIFVLATRRLWSNRGLMIGMAVGLVTAVALTMSIPLYADGVNTRLLRRALQDQQKDLGNRPPFAFMWRYIGAWTGAIEYDKYLAADRFMRSDGTDLIGLPVERAIRYVTTDNFRLHAVSPDFADPKQNLDWVSLGFLSDLADHVKVVDGRMPTPQAANDGRPLEVVITEAKANNMGIPVGEEFMLMSETRGQSAAYQLPVRVVGVWRPLDPADPYWFYLPTAFDGVLLTHEDSLRGRLAGSLKNPVYLALWYTIYNGQDVHTDDVPGLVGRIVTARTLANTTLPDLRLDISPLDALASYGQAVSLLTILLYVFAIPIIAVILYFIVQTTNLVVQRQRNEIAVLRSRGTSTIQLVGLYLLEGLLLGLVAMTLGPLLGLFVAQVMGNTVSFLVFSSDQWLSTEISQASLRLGIGAVVVSLVASMLPALEAARHTIVTYKQDIARSMQRPWWQRLYLDVMLLLVPLYGYYMLRQRGTLAVLGQSVSFREGDPFQNPLLFLVPTLFMFSLSLICIRLFPIVTEALARLTEYLPSTALLLALRQLARAWTQYTSPLLLIMLTLGLACFTASMAKTLDRALLDRTYYEVGADLRLVELGEPSGGGSESSGGMPGPALGGALGQTTKERIYWDFPPVSEHLRVPGVQAASRLATFSAEVNLGGRPIVGKLLGIDRTDFYQVAFFRPDFASSSLRSLMNRLTYDDSAVLVSRSFLAQHGLVIGDLFAIKIRQGNEYFDAPFLVAGVFDLFPTAYPSDGPIFVGNLDYIFERLGGEQPYDVLLRITPESNTRQILSGLRDMGLRIVGQDDARKMIQEEIERPERQGILGLLSVGFLVSVLLTVLGFLFYSFLSFRRRFIELGILRAIGLSRLQMSTFLGLEQCALIALGVLAGTGFGVLASSLFIPFLQVGTGSKATVPPFVVQIAWGDIAKIYVIFGVTLLFAVAGLVWLLMHMRIAEAVKLGESA